MYDGDGCPISELDDAARRALRDWVRLLGPTRLVFVDECWTHITLAPICTSAPKGQIALGKAPRDWGKNGALVASLSAEGMRATRRASREPPTRLPSRLTRSTPWLPPPRRDSRGDGQPPVVGGDRRSESSRMRWKRTRAYRSLTGQTVETTCPSRRIGVPPDTRAKALSPRSSIHNS
jgi:hypothetical protein